jgi:DNA invertase Pin-like site-specific DNA recombinase
MWKTENTNDPALSAQIAGIPGYAQGHGLALAGEFVDHGATGGRRRSPQVTRKGLQDILRPSSEVGTIIVTDRSRFMRDPRKARVHEDAVRERGIRLMVIQQPVGDAPNA